MSRTGSCDSMLIGQQKGSDMLSNQQKSLLLCAATAFALASSAQARPDRQKECPTMQGSSIFAWQYPCSEMQPRRRRQRQQTRAVRPFDPKTDCKKAVLRGLSEGGGDGDGGNGRYVTRDCASKSCSGPGPTLPPWAGLVLAWLGASQASGW
jgi:hypothetical protein